MAQCNAGLSEGLSGTCDGSAGERIAEILSAVHFTIEKQLTC
jgi:hypothetical protein